MQVITPRNLCQEGPQLTLSTEDLRQLIVSFIKECSCILGLLSHCHYWWARVQHASGIDLPGWKGGWSIRMCVLKPGIMKDGINNPRINVIAHALPSSTNVTTETDSCLIHMSGWSQGILSSATDWGSTWQQGCLRRSYQTGSQKSCYMCWYDQGAFLIDIHDNMVKYYPIVQPVELLSNTVIPEGERIPTRSTLTTEDDKGQEKEISTIIYPPKQETQLSFSQKVSVKMCHALVGGLNKMVPLSVSMTTISKDLPRSRLFLTLMQSSLMMFVLWLLNGWKGMLMMRSHVEMWKWTPNPRTLCLKNQKGEGVMPDFVWWLHLTQ